MELNNLKFEKISFRGSFSFFGIRHAMHNENSLTWTQATTPVFSAYESFRGWWLLIFIFPVSCADDFFLCFSGSTKQRDNKSNISFLSLFNFWFFYVIQAHNEMDFFLPFVDRKWKATKRNLLRGDSRNSFQTFQH
jgi:hypothetical protein